MGGGVSAVKKRERPLYGPHPTRPPKPHTKCGVGRRLGMDNRIASHRRRLKRCPCSRLGGHSGRETPGPIPNPEAKPDSADGTAPARVWESRTPPSTNPLVQPPRGLHDGAPQGAESVSVGRSSHLDRRETVRSPVRSSCLVHTVSTRGQRKGLALGVASHLLRVAVGESTAGLTKGCPRRDRRPHERDCEWHRRRCTALAHGVRERLGPN